MELCTSTRCIPNHLTPFTPYRPTLQWRCSLPLKFHPIARNYPGSRYYSYFSIKATSSEETSSGANQYVKEEPDVINYSSIKATTPEETSNETNQYVKDEPESEVTDDEVQAEEKSGFGGFGLFKDDAETNDQFPQFDFLNKLKVELDFEDSFSIALLSVGGIAALWLTASIVGAIDNIPLFPKLMEVVGLGYTIWFSSRYLLFKRNRDELASKIEEIKQQVLGGKVDM
ncbi:protein CURVATURE THYLAKOID 1D, chloroplastic-like [Cynara cardunculus var. scolymus]|uniref:protein CURVATURE THYLAKOID 1D, chloroplastic-like n=1 Tax=Cynara cardunculus var. scolymus TaxID=59895 RepID=UPI000D63107A|nr:protein CURVATURE THYLAKOID 1D, chloroplastic-like [Cynara cardunculus var. scolymus]